MSSGDIEGLRSMVDYLDSAHVVMLESRDKHSALRELVEAVFGATSDSLMEECFSSVWEREQSLSTRLLPRIALPHARVEGLGRPVVGIGIQPEGIRWDPDEEEPVCLVILIAGPAKEHLKVLGRIATRLSNKDLCRELLEARSGHKVYDLLTQPYALASTVRHPKVHDLSVRCFNHALAMAREISAGALVLHVDAVGDISFLENCDPFGIRLIAVARDVTRYPAMDAVERFLPVPFGGANRTSQIDVALLFLVSHGQLSRDDRVISVCGVPESGVLDTIMVADLKNDYRLFFPDGDDPLPRDIEPQVLARVLQVAASLGDEGREGKPVGTMFVLGDYDAVRDHCRQLVINPFKGYPESERNILDPGLQETIKEFSRMDGAFVIRGDGVIVSAGTYIRTGGGVDRLSPGLGARHATSAMISSQTRALAVALSESTRKVSVFRNGERMLEL